MKNKEKGFSKKAGLAPGSLVHVGKRKTDQIRISAIDYHKEEFSEMVFDKPEDCFHLKDAETVSWINIDGLHDTESIDKIGKHFGLHPLLIEDILNTSHRPKMEEFNDHIFITLKMLSIDNDSHALNKEQLSLVLGRNWILSFQEQQGDIFEAFRQRIKENKGVIRQKGNDYLFYRLIDIVVDNYFLITEHISDVTEKLEEKVLASPDNESLGEIHRLKSLLVNLRKSSSPLRDAVSGLQKDSNHIISEETLPFLRDVYEHIIQVNETIETQRDLVTGIMDLYLSGVSNKMNQVMKVLTIIATIFIPLTFIAGIYGMNFESMPELHWKYGYAGVWGLMVVIFIFMLIYFKRKRWL